MKHAQKIIFEYILNAHKSGPRQYDQFFIDPPQRNTRSHWWPRIIYQLTASFCTFFFRVPIKCFGQWGG